MLFASSPYRCIELAEAAVPKLQAFFEANPEYHVAVDGRRPRPGEAREEFDSQLPPGWPFEKRWLVEFAAPDGEMIGMASVVSNLFAYGIWHIGLFIVATRLHGHGEARLLYEGLEKWMGENGARWLRLGVVEGNARAERFWEKAGYVEVKKRLGVEMGERTNTLRVMVKPLAGGAIAEYLASVPRDRPEGRAG